MNSSNQVMSAFLRAILLRMKALGLNQTALARRMKVSRAYVSKVLQGQDVNFSFATAFTFVATSHALKRIGATPIFADIDPTYYGLTPEDVTAIAENVKGMV